MQLDFLCKESSVKYLRTLGFVALMAGLSSWSGAARADVGPLLILEGGAAAPKSSHRSIRLEHQEVTIRLGKKTYLVEAQFQLFNTSRSTTEWVGFPERLTYRALSTESSHFIRFDAWVDGRKTQVTEERDLSDTKSGRSSLSRENRWMVLRVTFPARKRTTIRCLYEAPYEHGGHRKAMTYIYGTGSYWKDTVGSAIFIVDAAEIGGTRHVLVNLTPASGPRKISGSLLSFEMRDFKPSPEARFEVVLTRKPRERSP